MHRNRKGQRLTRSNAQAMKDARAVLEDMNPTKQLCTSWSKTEDMDLHCMEVSADTNDGTMYTDFSGRFPTRSYRNMQCIFVGYAYQYQPNAIILEPMKSRESTSMVEAFQNVYKYLMKCGHKPKLNGMDNECSKGVKDYLEKEKTKIQFVEADNHSVNASKRAIQSIKNHFLASLATVAKEFSVQL